MSRQIAALAEIPRPAVALGPLPDGFPVNDPEALEPEELLRASFNYWGRDLVLCTSLQSEGIILLDMAVRLFADVRVFTIDTGRLPEETHAFAAEVRRHFGVPIEVYAPDSFELSRLATRRGPNAFRDSVLDRQICCRIRKVHPLQAVLEGASGPRPAAWMTGLRRSQNDQRAGTPKLGRDPKHAGLWKLAPLSGWTSAQVEAYTAEHKLPRHPLYAQGYRSIGCGPCTRAVQPGEHERAGRWWWEEGMPKECGLHFSADGHLRRQIDVALDDLLRD